MNFFAAIAAMPDLADNAPAQERDSLVRSAGVVGRTVDAVVRDTLGEVAHAGAEAAT
jgi:hypothetical protein